MKDFFDDHSETISLFGIIVGVTVLFIGLISIEYNYEKTYVEKNDCHLTGNTKTEEYSYWVTTDPNTGAGYVDFRETTTYEYYCEVTGTNKWFDFRFDN